MFKKSRTQLLLLCFASVVLSCKNESQTLKNIKSQSIVVDSGKNKITGESNYVAKFVVYVGESCNFDSLNRLSIELSDKFNIPYDTTDQIFNKKIGIINSKDSIYYPRNRNNEKERLTIEMAYVFKEDDELIRTDNQLMRLICLVCSDIDKAEKEKEKFYQRGYIHTKIITCKLSTLDSH